MAEAFHLSVGSDRNMVSRESVGNIRSAFLEMYGKLIFSIIRDFVSVRVQGARGASGSIPTFVGIYMSHVQDEAELRLLSMDPSSGPGLPRRSRTSKVQIHVVHVSCDGRMWGVPVELEGLVDKTARTLATSFERLLLTFA